MTERGQIREPLKLVLKNSNDKENMNAWDRRLHELAATSKSSNGDKGWYGGRAVLGERINGQRRSIELGSPAETRVSGKSHTAKDIDSCYVALMDDDYEEMRQLSNDDEDLDEPAGIDLAGESDGYTTQNFRDLREETDSEYEHYESQDTMGEAYAKMTRNAGPLPGLAGKKRAREIAERDTSASNEPPNPHQYPDSDPARASKRLRIAQDEPRRCSTPSHLGRSLVKEFSPAPVPEVDLQDLNLNNKSYLSAPGWMKQGIRELLGKDPNALLEPDGVNVKCLDCGGVYKTTSNRTFGPVATHLKGKGHIARVSERVEQRQKWQQDMLTPISKTSLFKEPVERLSVYAQPEATETADLAAQFIVGMQKQASKKAMDISRTQQQLDILEKRFVPVEQKTVAVEKKIVAMEQNLHEIIKISKTGTAKHKKLVDQQTSMEKTIKDNNATMKTKFGTIRDLTIKHDDEIEKLRDKGLRTEARVKAMEGQLQQSDKKHGGAVSKLEARIERHDLEMKAEIGKCQETNPRGHVAIENVNKQHVNELSTRLRATEERMHFVATQSQQNAAYLSGRAQNDAVFAQRMTTLERNQAYYTQELPKQVQRQREGTDRLQREVSVLRNQIQKQEAPLERQPGGGSQQPVDVGRLQLVLEQQMAARFAQYDAQYQAQKLENEARIQRIEAKNAQHNQALESSIQKLKDENAGLESLVPKLAQEVLGLRQCFDASLESVNDNFAENDNFLDTLAEQIAQARRDIECYKDRRSVRSAALDSKTDSPPEEIGELQKRIEMLEDVFRRQSDRISAPLCGTLDGTKELRERIRILEEERILVPSSDRVVESIETLQHIETLEEQIQKQRVQIEAVLPMCVSEIARLREELEKSQIKARVKFNVIAKTFPAIIEDTKQLRDCIGSITDFIEEEQEETLKLREEFQSSQDEARAKFNDIGMTFPAIIEDTKLLREYIDNIADFIEGSDEEPKEMAECNDERPSQQPERHTNDFEVKDEHESVY